jgi:CRISPR-associated endonuclease/helicase Cas3
MMMNAISMKKWDGVFGYMNNDLQTNLLAKPNETILEHTKNALKVFKSIKESYPNIPEICGVEDFWEHLFYSIFFHDFGKGAIGFQEMLNDYTKTVRWKYRHEILSAGFASSLHYDEIYKNAIGLAIITHHKDINVLRERYNTFPSPTGKKLYDKKLKELEPNFQDLIEYFDLLPDLSRQYLGYELKNFSLIDFNDLKNVYKDSALPYYIEWEDEEYTILHEKYGIFLRGFLNACDHLSSGSKYEILKGIEDMQSIYNFSSLRKIQTESISTKGSAFLTSPTGSGKTEASLFWSDSNQNFNHSKRVFYLLPYTASINAMYNRLQEDFKNKELVGLTHGKSSYFIYKALSDYDFDYESKKKLIRDIKGLTKKIYRPYKVLTPFQILKSFFGPKGFEMQLSEMTNGLFILDEIHAYDAHTTALILEILKILKTEYRADLFIMSATLPSFIKELFKEYLDIPNDIVMENDELRSFTRHKVKIIDGTIFDNLDYIIKDLKDKKRVLIVCNTVLQAQKVFDELKSKVEHSALLHSRFMLSDREKIEKTLDNLQLLVGTQAIEVSLDISYDILYSEPAPIDALIQRFGRVNRKGWEKGNIAMVNIFSKGSDKDKYIYNPSLVEKTIKSFEDIDILSEDLIQKLVDKVYESGYDEKDQKEFNSVQKHFKSFHDQIVPFINDKNNEVQFYSLFESYEVVPFKYKLDYIEEIENGRYYEAMGYVLSISIGQFKKLQKENNVEFDEETYFVNTLYDSKKGLMLDSEEDGFY